MVEARERGAFRSTDFGQHLTFPYLRIALFSPLCADGWNLADDNIFTSVGSADDDYLILSLEVPGFRSVTYLFLLPMKLRSTKK